MKKIRPVVLSVIGLSIVLILAVGCYRPAAPDVTATPAGGAEAAPTETSEGEEGEEGEIDLEGTAIANATLAAQTPEEPGEGEASPTETPTEPVPTSTPTSSAPTPTTESTAPQPTEPAATTAPSAPSEETATHVVQRGENLFRIALRYNTTVEAIAKANGIADPRRIYVGQSLTIPSPGSKPSPPPTGEGTYVVQPGDNLFRIALRYNMSYLYLAQYNGISNPSSIHVGQVLRIPPH